MHIVTMSSRGRLTIPARLRKRLRVYPGTKVGVFDLDGKIYVRKIDKNYFLQFAGIVGTKGKFAKDIRQKNTKRY
ncbi:MAG: AbrB/MazE/SpoVT family DNA-binding domain-containing protein [Ignavibacteriales bacterium]|nr:AbrB/MazE/SpoVT family DNA-binding domain-containing protein [Ignavibacteriales bacterium]